MFWWTIDAAPAVNVRYPLTRNREIYNFYTTGIELYTYDATTQNVPDTVELNGKLYNTLRTGDASKIKVTWCDYDGNWLEFEKPIVSYNRFPTLANNVLLDLRNYYMQIFPPRSYFNFVALGLVTPLPIAIPFVFYWSDKVKRKYQ